MADLLSKLYLGGKLTALVGVDDLGCAVPPERDLKDIDGMSGFQRDRQLGRQDLTTGPIHHSRQVRSSAPS